MAEINLGTLYDFNKQAMTNEKPLDPILFNTKIKEIGFDSHWLMLLCHERKDYTVFHLISKEGWREALKETLNNRGYVLAIDKQEDGNYEIWIRDFETDENFVYYLFDYQYGIVEE